MRLHESHEEGGFGVSNNTITRHAVSYTTNARFVAWAPFVGTRFSIGLQVQPGNRAGQLASCPARFPVCTCSPMPGCTCSPMETSQRCLRPSALGDVCLHDARFGGPHP
jgi:hypothetical protein